MADKKQYRVLAEGLSWPKGGRAEKGDVTDQIPAKSVEWLLEQGHIEEVKGNGGGTRQ